ncbi:MAG: DnaJ domain-containing protein [Deltaproteobacteria bacterium]|nr:DnaJ domain-containing protein [Deltaproteobacteria bacterium]
MKAILVVEPHAPTAESLRQALARAGFGVRVAREVGEAQALFAAERPDAVVLAADLPRAHGRSLGASLRASPEGKGLPLLAVDKAHVGPSHVAGVRCVLEFRPDGYFPDGSRCEDIVGRLRHLLERAQPAPAPVAAREAWEDTLARPPVLTFDLAQSPLPEELHGLWRLRRDGILVIANGEAVRRLFLLQGAPVAFESSVPGEDFAAHLEREGLMPGPEARRLASLRGLGTWELALKVVRGPLPADAFRPAWSAWVRARAASLVGTRKGRAAFYAGAGFRGAVDEAAFPALAPVLDGARQRLTAKQFSLALRGLGTRYPHRTVEFAADLPALGLDVEDVKFALQLDGTATTRELLAHGRGELHRRWSLLWFLRLTGDVAFALAPLQREGASAYGAPEASAHRRRKRLPPQQDRSLRDAALEIITGSYFRALGLELTARAEEVEAAYARRVETFHPDSYPDHDLSDVEDLFGMVLERLGAARRVLGSPEKRRAYVAYLMARSGQRQGGTVPEAEVEMKRGEAAMLGGDWPAARRAFDHALLLDPTEPRYYPFAAWATWQVGGRPERERAASALGLLKKALALDAGLPRAHVVAAIIEARMGERAAARARLERVLAAHPSLRVAHAALEALG